VAAILVLPLLRNIINIERGIEIKKEKQKERHP
jgi:hypothetical protein